MHTGLDEGQLTPVQEAYSMRVQNRSIRGKLERGQSFIELAISLVFFLVLILGMLDLARVFYIYVALEDSADIAAVYMSQHPDCIDGGSDEPAECQGKNNAKYRAQHASGANIDWSHVEIYPAKVDAGESEAMVKVRMIYSFKLLTPVISNIVGSDRIKLTADASHVRLD